MKKANKFLYNVSKTIMLVCVFLVTILVIGGVILRNFMGISIPWCTELARYFLIATTFMGANVALYEGSHVGVTLFVKKTPLMLKRILILISNIATAWIIIVIIKYSWICAIDSWNITGDILPFSMFYVKVMIPIGSLFMVINLLSFILNLFRKDEDSENYLMSRPVAIGEEPNRK